MQGFLSLGMGKLQVKQAAVRFNHRHAIEFSSGTVVFYGTEVSPVYLALMSGIRFKPYKGFRGFSSLRSQIVS
jgi:hypothetical protein